MEPVKKSSDVKNRSSEQSAKEKAIDLAVQAIEKQFGKGSIMRLGLQETLVPQGLSVVSTGSMSLDIALGIGGYPPVEGLLKFMVLSLQERPRLPCMQLPRFKSRVVWRLLSMLSTL